MKHLIYYTIIIATLIIGAHQSSFASADSLKLELAFQKFDEAKACYSGKKKRKKRKCREILQESYELSGSHSHFMKEIIEYLMSIEDYKETRIYLQRLKVDTLAPSLKSQYYYFKGIIDLQSGCGFFDEANGCFRQALRYEKKSEIVNALHLSKIYNAIGFTKMIYDADNRVDKKDYAHGNWVESDVRYALRCFYTALHYDPRNTDAQINWDSLYSKMLLSDMNIDINDFTVEDDFNLSYDTLDSHLQLDIESHIDTLKEVNLNYLPSNVGEIKSKLSKYDELLFVSDISGSMEIDHPSIGVGRFTIMKEMLTYLANGLKIKRLGMTTVGGSCYDSPFSSIPTTVENNAMVSQAISTLSCGGATPLINSLLNVKPLFSRDKKSKAILLVTDGMDTCADNDLDLCLLAEDLQASGIDIHIVSFIVEGMEDYGHAYHIYNCMTEVESGTVYEFTNDSKLKDRMEEDEDNTYSMILPTIKVGEELNMNYIEVYHSDLCE